MHRKTLNVYQEQTLTLIPRVTALFFYSNEKEASNVATRTGAAEQIEQLRAKKVRTVIQTYDLKAAELSPLFPLLGDGLGDGNGLYRALTECKIHRNGINSIREMFFIAYIAKGGVSITTTDGTSRSSSGRPPPPPPPHAGQLVLYRNGWQETMKTREEHSRTEPFRNVLFRWADPEFANYPFDLVEGVVPKSAKCSVEEQLAPLCALVCMWMTMGQPDDNEMVALYKCSFFDLVHAIYNLVSKSISNPTAADRNDLLFHVKLLMGLNNRIVVCMSELSCRDIKLRAQIMAEVVKYAVKYTSESEFMPFQNEIRRCVGQPEVDCFTIHLGSREELDISKQTISSICEDVRTSAKPANPSKLSDQIRDQVRNAVLNPKPNPKSIPDPRPDPRPDTRPDPRPDTRPDPRTGTAAYAAAMGDAVAVHAAASVQAPKVSGPMVLNRTPSNAASHSSFNEPEQPPSPPSQPNAQPPSQPNAQAMRQRSAAQHGQASQNLMMKMVSRREVASMSLQTGLVVKEERLKQEEAKLDQERARLAQAQKDADEQREDYKKRLYDLRQAKVDFANDKNCFKQKVDAEVEKRVQEIESELTSKKDNAVEAFNREYRAKSKALATLEETKKKLSSANKDAHTFKQERDDALAKQQVLEIQLSNLKRDYEQKVTLLTDANNKIGELTTEHADLQQQVEQLKEDLDAAKTELKLKPVSEMSSSSSCSSSLNTTPRTQSTALTSPTQSPQTSNTTSPAGREQRSCAKGKRYSDCDDDPSDDDEFRIHSKKLCCAWV